MIPVGFMYEEQICFLLIVLVSAQAARCSGDLIRRALIPSDVGARMNMNALYGGEPC